MAGVPSQLFLFISGSAHGASSPHFRAQRQLLCLLEELLRIRSRLASGEASFDPTSHGREPSEGRGWQLSSKSRVRNRPKQTGTAAMAGNEDPKAAVDALINEGRHRLCEEDFEAAAAKFEEARRSDPTSVKAFLNLGTAKTAGGDWTGAAAVCERALELAREPNDKSQAHLGLGFVRRGLGDLTGSLESFRASVQLTQAGHPYVPVLISALSEALVDVGQLEEAEFVLETCPKNFEIWALSGRLQTKKYNFKQADKVRERPPCGVPFHHEAGP